MAGTGWSTTVTEQKPSIGALARAANSTPPVSHTLPAALRCGVARQADIDARRSAGPAHANRVVEGAAPGVGSTSFVGRIPDLSFEPHSPGWILGLIAALAFSPALARAQATTAAPCTLFYHEAGDAPEGFAPYPGLAVGHFPTCATATAAGTQEIECGAPRSSAPGPTGRVKHIAGFDFAPPFWLGCGSAPPALGGIDGESEGKTGPAGGGNTCGGGTVDCTELTPWGMSFGQDECLGDLDAGVDGPVEFTACSTTRLRFRATLCELDSRFAYLNVLVDWNQDGDWNDNLSCAATTACAPEWAVKNVPLTLTRGCGVHETPDFTVGPHVGPGWMRVTLTSEPVHDEFPWAGSDGSPEGNFNSGETEDHPVMIRSLVLGVADPGTESGPRLDPAVPSPSRQGCTLRYVLTRSGPVRAEVIDAGGRRVRALDCPAGTAGEHFLAWDGRDGAGRTASAGLYWIWLEAEGRTLVRRAVHLR